jgi:hypothetical protein
MLQHDVFGTMHRIAFLVHFKSRQNLKDNRNSINEKQKKIAHRNQSDSLSTKHPGLRPQWSPAMRSCHPVMFGVRQLSQIVAFASVGSDSFANGNV